MRAIRLVGGAYGLLLSASEWETMRSMVTAYCLGETFPLVDDTENGYENVRYTNPRTAEYWQIYAKMGCGETRGAEETPISDD